jgi:hypothetical protein
MLINIIVAVLDALGNPEKMKKLKESTIIILVMILTVVTVLGTVALWP